jgi:hypothetical protein
MVLRRHGEMSCAIVFVAHLGLQRLESTWCAFRDSGKSVRRTGILLRDQAEPSWAASARGAGLRGDGDQTVAQQEANGLRAAAQSKMKSDVVNATHIVLRKMNCDALGSACHHKVPFMCY